MVSAQDAAVVHLEGAACAREDAVERVGLLEMRVAEREVRHFCRVRVRGGVNDR